MITFAIEELQYEGTLIILNDKVVENVEQLSLQIEALDGVFPVNVVDATVMVTIIDDDGEIILVPFIHTIRNLCALSAANVSIYPFVNSGVFPFSCRANIYYARSVV